MHKLIRWGIPFFVVMGIGAFTVFGSLAGIKPVQDETPSTHTQHRPSSDDTSASRPSFVLSESTETPAAQSPSYEETLAQAEQQCRQAGYADDSAAMNDCVEQTTSQLGH